MSEQQTAGQPENSGGGEAGKKVFLLYPHSVIREEMLDILIMNGFETYTLFDHKKAVKILERFPSSIIFINIDEGIPEKEWEAYIRALMNNPGTKETKIGILSYNQDKALMGKYLMEIAVHCGYIQLKLGIQESTKIILNALQANEAKGRRKYIRAFCESDTLTSINYKSDKGFLKGQILDISSAGLAAKIGNFPDMPPNSLLREVQLKLHGTLLLTDMVLMGKRRDDTNILILLFNPTAMKSDHKMLVYHYIKDTLQKYIDNLRI